MPNYLTDLPSRLAARDNDAPLFTFLSATGEELNISARQLHGDAGQIAMSLRYQGIRPGQLVPLVFEHGYDVVATFWGAMYAGAIPTILPFISPEPRSNSTLEQVKRLARFAEADTIIAPTGHESYLRKGFGDTAVNIIGLPQLTPDSPKNFAGRLSDSHHDGPPYVQFSSGTTGRPKGVCLSEAGVLNYLGVAVKNVECSDDDVMVGWLPLYHDMGLVNQVLQPMYGGYRSVFINPADWLREPHRLFQAVTRYRGSLNWMPNFGFRYCLRRVSDSQLEGVDLSSWRIAGNGSEPALLEDVVAFAKRFAQYGLRESAVAIGYGMAEHVAGLTWTPHNQVRVVDWVSEQGLAAGTAIAVQPMTEGSRAIISCGPPMPSAQLHIVDAAGTVLPERAVGELLVQSPMLFEGYYKQPEETARAMNGGWFHTGDLGYLSGGELFICGRTKDLIIVAGRNIHPLQLEEIAESVMGPHGRFAAAFGITNTSLGTETPIVVCEMRHLPDQAEQARIQQQIRDQARRALEVFVADVKFVGPGWVVRTTSGKINRGANREKYLSDPNPA